MKYAKIQAYSDPHFPVFGHDLLFCPNTGKKTDTILSIYGKIWIRESRYFSIFHAVSCNDIERLLKITMFQLPFYKIKIARWF